MYDDYDVFVDASLIFFRHCIVDVIREEKCAGDARIFIRLIRLQLLRQKKGDSQAYERRRKHSILIELIKRHDVI